jgi:hypothetical protein
MVVVLTENGSGDGGLRYVLFYYLSALCTSRAKGKATLCVP